jgi:hypothetical protein
MSRPLWNHNASPTACFQNTVGSTGHCLSRLATRQTKREEVLIARPISEFTEKLSLIPGELHIPTVQKNS